MLPSLLFNRLAAISKRFTLFHEAFHILTHCNTTPTFSRIGVTQGSFNELLADVFAVFIMMPREWVEEVGREFNVTRERIRQIQDKALRRLRHIRNGT